METRLHNYQAVPLTEEYLDWFVDVAARRMLCEEVGRPDLYNQPHILGLARKVMEAKTSLIVTKNDQPVGAIAGFLVGNLYNPSKTVLAEVMWYVLPDYRSTRAGYLLLKEWECLAREINADEMTFSTLPSSNVSLEKHGFTLAEYAYRKGL